MSFQCSGVVIVCSAAVLIQCNVMHSAVLAEGCTRAANRFRKGVAARVAS